MEIRPCSSWAEVVKEFDRLYSEAKSNKFEPPDTNLFDYITLKMLCGGAGNPIGYKFPEDLRSFRSSLANLKEQARKAKKRKKRLKIKSFGKRITSDEFVFGYVKLDESLEEQVQRLGLQENTYF